jgi:hypothetical protein
MEIIHKMKMKTTVAWRDIKRLPLLLWVVIVFVLTGVGYLVISKAAITCPSSTITGDTNCDYKVDILDLSYFLSKFGTHDTAADVNNDTNVNVLDLSVILSNYGKVKTATTTATSTCGWGTFTQTNMPGACWRPYGDTSAFNTKLPDNPKLYNKDATYNSAKIVANLMNTDGAGIGDGTARGLHPTISSTNSYYHAYFISKPTDPEYVISCTRGSNGSAPCPVGGQKIRIPANAKPAGGTDHHMHIIDQTNNVIWGFFDVQSIPVGGGTVTVGTASKAGYTSTGLYPVDTVSPVASFTGAMGGMIRQPELAANHIDHSLFIVIKCSALDGNYRLFPANPINYDPGCANSLIPQGATFQLDLTDTQVDAMTNIAPWQKTILKAMHNYGMFVGDEGSNGAFEFTIESPETWVGVTNPWISYAQTEMPKANSHITGSGSSYEFNFNDGFTQSWWASHLRMVDPCVIQKSC